MMSTRGYRRRKQTVIEEARQNSTTHQKCSRRRSEEVPVPFASTSSPWSLRRLPGTLQKTRGHSASLRAATRNLNPNHVANSGKKIQEWQHCTSEPTVKPDIDCEIPEKDVKPTVATESPVWAGHTDNEHSHHLRLVAPQESDVVAPQPTSDQPSRENVVPENNTTSHVTASLNITEFARRQQDGEDDDVDEVQSVLNSVFDYVKVKGREVKKEHAPLVRAIFDKYGDITSECVGKPPKLVSFFLESVCIIYQKLKETKFSEATGRDLNEMLDMVMYLESEKLNLGWLREKLQCICETKASFKSYLTFKEEGKWSDAIITTLEKELEENKRQRYLLEDKLIAEKAKSDEMKIKVGEIKVKVDHLCKHSLVDDLL